MAYFPLLQVAHQLGIPCSWLRARAERGEVPVLRVGRRLLADPDSIRRVLDTEAGDVLSFAPVELMYSGAAAAYIGITQPDLLLLAEGRVVPSFRAGGRFLFQVDRVHSALHRRGGAMAALKEVKDAQAHTQP